MKKPVISPQCLKPQEDKLLQKIQQKCGAYYHSADLFYHELWKQRFVHMGFRVIMVRKDVYHDSWEIRLCGSLAAQNYLLTCKPVAKKSLWIKDLLCQQLRAEVRRIAQELGPPIPAKFASAVRNGKAYFLVTFIWPRGKPGMLLKKEKVTEGFSFLIQPWLQKNRN